MVALGTPSTCTLPRSGRGPVRGQLGAEFVASESGEGTQLVVSVVVHEPVSLPAGPCSECFGSVGPAVQGLPTDGCFESIRSRVHGPRHSGVDQWKVVGCRVSWACSPRLAWFTATGFRLYARSRRDRRASSWSATALSRTSGLPLVMALAWAKFRVLSPMPMAKSKWPVGSVREGLLPDSCLEVEGLGNGGDGGSSSTPVISADSGANPLKVPTPDPGSSTLPPSNPSSCTAAHMAFT